MLSFLYEIHFWTFNDEIYISNNDFGAFKYYDKKELPISAPCEKKKDYVLSRNYLWAVSNKKPYRLKQSLKEVEECIESQRIVRVKWLKETVVILFFNSGTIAYIHVDPSSGDVYHVGFDKYLKDKLLSPHVCDVLVTNLFSVCCYNDPQLTLIYNSKPAFKKIYRKFTDLEPKFSSVSLPGPSGRRLPRKLCANKTGDVIAVWWQYSENDVFPWSPFVKDIDRANIHVYSVLSSKLEILCYYRTEHDLLCLAFSSVESNILYAVEQKISREGDVSIESSTFEIVKCSRLQRANVVSISLRSSACCIEFSPDRSNMILGCVDGSLVLFNQTRALTHIVQIVFVPSIVRWHCDGYVVAVASDRGQIQCFDFALCCIKMQCVSEDVTPSSITDLSIYFTQRTRPQPPLLIEMEWNVKNCKNETTESSSDDSFLLLTFSEGPLVVLRIFSTVVVVPEFLVTQYLKAEQIDNAINVLLAMDWDINPTTCLILLQKITNYIFISSLSSPTEKYPQIQAALGSFYSPVRPISHSVEMEFYKSVRNISRRLFYYVLRHDFDDLAFNIASQLNEHDLFMDLYYYAKSINNPTLVATARERAQQINAEESAPNFSSGSEDCDCSCSNCSCENSEDCISLQNASRTTAEQLPSSNILLESPVNHLAFASVTRVGNTQQRITTQKETEKREVQTNSSGSISFNQPTPLSDHKKISSPEALAEMKSNMNLQVIEKPQGLQFSDVSSISNTSICKNLPNDIAQGLMQQTSLAESKILESKSIKVVHFGVV